MTGATRTIRRSAVTGGGLLASAASYTLNTSLNEAGVSSFTSANFRLTSGLMPIIPQPGTVTEIIAVSKTTGTLELNWVAPGRDGFLGSVSAGYYRIDTSSELSHIFAPTTFITEFSTTVSPGDAQAYTLTDLDPNTTYFTRIYLVDAEKTVAETSAQEEESTLAHPPASPVLSAVFASSVTFSWSLPAKGATGYRIDGSSTNFGTSFPGGAVASSKTADGTMITLTVEGLTSETTYYFKLGSLNWQSDINFTTIIATFTLPAIPSPIENLSLIADATAKTVRFTWTSPDYWGPAGTMVLVSTNPITAEVNSIAYSRGFTFPDGTVVRSSAAYPPLLDQGLGLDTTYFYRFYSKNTINEYSVHVSTEILLDLPPMAPSGLHASINNGGTQITVNWATCTSSLDGTPFKAPTPISRELLHFDIFRATGIIRSNWVHIDSVAANATSWSGAVPDPNETYYYKIVSKDTFPDVDTAMVADNSGNIYAVGPDQVSRLKIPSSMTHRLEPGGNKFGQPLLVRSYERPGEAGGKIARSVHFETIQAPLAEEAEGFQFPYPVLDVTMHYDVLDGQVAPSAYNPRGFRLQAQAPLNPAVTANNAPDQLANYWHNGKKYVKLFGKVDTVNQTVTVKTAVPGSFQVRSLQREAGFTLDTSQISNKVITPNNDGLNDYVVFRFDNPKDSGFEGKIFDIRGAFVSGMREGTQVPDSLVWDGKANGRTVPRGVYIYQIKSEDKIFNGTVLVIR